MIKKLAGREFQNKNEKASSLCNLEKDPVFNTEKGKVSSNVPREKAFEKFQKGTKFPKEG